MEKFSIKNLKNKNIYFVGIGGIGMSALAMILKKYGANVSGSDLQENREVCKLKKTGVKVFNSHSKRNLKNIDFLVYSSAISNDNVELKFARDHNIKIFKRAELLGLIAKDYKHVIAVSGSHGKTTVSSLIASIFMQAKKKPTFLIGGELENVKSNFKIGNKKFLILEACEYKDNFLYIKPDIAVVLNIDSDHLDYFKDLENVKKSFKTFADGVNFGGMKIVCDEDKNSICLKTGDNFATFGFSKNVDLKASKIREYEPGKYSFSVSFENVLLGKIKLNILGKHNVLNALASILVGLICAVDFEDIKTALENYKGVKRRSEIIYDKNDVLMIHDYAHHPAQIEKMILTAKDLAKKKKGRIIVVFEPHTYSRTKMLLLEFAKSFRFADHVIFAPVYSARENINMGVQSNVLAEKTLDYVYNVEYIESYFDIENRINLLVKKNDVVLFLGAGTIENLAYRFKEK